jgi:hypothetical protein
MIPMLRFDEVVDAVDRLSLDEKETLSKLLRRRVQDEKRKQFVEEVEESRRDYERGDFKEVTVEELMREVES